MFLVYSARLFPDVKRKGNASVPQLVIFTSEQVCLCDFLLIAVHNLRTCIDMCYHSQHTSNAVSVET